jgi:hypothetical protein
MAGTTPTYSWPYPTGTDRVADGDNAIQALAVAIENSFKGTRGWGARFATPAGFPGDSSWRPLVANQLTGIPIGSVVACMGNATLSPSTAPGTYMQISFTNSTGLAHTGGLTAPPVAKMQSTVANSYVNLTVFDLFVVTGANPTVALYGFANGGTISVDAETHQVITRLT